MITVAIVAILAAVALPAYQNFTVRSRVSEGLYFAGAAKANVADVASSGYHGGMGYNAGFSSLDPNVNTDDTQNINGLQIDGATGVITVIFTKVAGGGTPGSESITLSPAPLAILTLGGRESFTPPMDTISWSCASTMDTRLIPPTCR